ncbi:MAG TPA: hypothetical protein VF576_02300 [Rubricoccaceae bacterium]|jgi:putative membrane protein
MADSVLSEADLDRIRVAVGAAEKRTAGEIVPFVVRQSGDYDVSTWRAASVGALLAAAAALGAAWLYDGWGLTWLYSSWAVEAATVLGGVVGALVGEYVPAARRLLAGPGLLAETVHRRAAQAFLDEEVFTTRDRTGILLFVSLFEHRIEVVGDSGINAKVETAEWVAVVDLVRAGIQRGDLAGGLVAAIDLCGDLLHRRGVAVRDDDTDELTDGVRLRDA